MYGWRWMDTYILVAVECYVVFTFQIKSSLISGAFQFFILLLSWLHHEFELNHYILGSYSMPLIVFLTPTAPLYPVNITNKLYLCT